MAFDTCHFTCFPDENYLAIVGTKPRVISWENGKEVLKFPTELVNSITYSGYEYLSHNLKALSDFTFIP